MEGQVNQQAGVLLTHRDHRARPARKEKDTYWFFKLFNSIKDEHEVDLAELELVSLMGPVEKVRNFADVLNTTPLKHFTSDPARIQDALSYEPCYGRFQGFMAKRQEIPVLERLIRRLAYTREVIGVFGKQATVSSFKGFLPRGKSRKGVATYTEGDYKLIRLVTNQYYLEKSAYVSKLSRDEKEIKRNAKILLNYPFQQLYRIPASATMSVGKRLEDYFAIREESSLYLTHMLHPYKGKFHSKMVRALLNYVMPGDDGNVMDNFAGSGTLLVEATLMGLNSTGVEINPLSAIMSAVKSDALIAEPHSLANGITRFHEELSAALVERPMISSGNTLLVGQNTEGKDLEGLATSVPKSVLDRFQSRELIAEFLIAHRVVRRLVVEESVRRFLLLGLSGSISDLARRISGTLLDVLSDRLFRMFRSVLLFRELNKGLKIRLGKSRTLLGDARNMRICKTLDGRLSSIPDQSVDCIVNSPPYSAALDYIRNDLPQLTILGLAESLDELERNMIGSSNLGQFSDELLLEVERGSPEFNRLPGKGKQAINQLLDEGRIPDALRVFKFFKDMHLSLLEIRRVLKPGGRSVIIIGNNNYKVDGKFIQVRNDEVIAEMGESIGLRRDKGLPLIKEIPDNPKVEPLVGGIRRRLEKTMAGMIRYETVLVLEKPA